MGDLELIKYFLEIKSRFKANLHQCMNDHVTAHTSVLGLRCCLNFSQTTAYFKEVLYKKLNNNTMSHIFHTLPKT